MRAWRASILLGSTTLMYAVRSLGYEDNVTNTQREIADLDLFFADQRVDVAENLICHDRSLHKGMATTP